MDIRSCGDGQNKRNGKIVFGKDNTARAGRLGYSMSGVKAKFQVLLVAAAIAPAFLHPQIQVPEQAFDPCLLALA